jgi:hypothetical protein
MAGRYDDPMTELTLSHQSGTVNLDTGPLPTPKKAGLIPCPSAPLPHTAAIPCQHSHFSPPPPRLAEGKTCSSTGDTPGGEMSADLPNKRRSIYYCGGRSLGLATKKSLILICWFATLATLCELSAASSADQVAGVADGSGTTADESRSSSMQAFQSAGLIPQIFARAPKDVLQVGCSSVQCPLKCSLVKPVLEVSPNKCSASKRNEMKREPFASFSSDQEKKPVCCPLCFSIYAAVGICC